MIIFIILTELLALLFFVIGRTIGKGNIESIHSYHRKNVKDEDKMAYAKLHSKGMYSIALGFFIEGIVNYLRIENFDALIIFGSIAIGFLFFNKAQKKYNGSWFS